MLLSRVGFTNLLWLVLAVACSPVIGALDTGDQSSVAEATVSLPPINSLFKLSNNGIVGELVNGAQLWIQVTDTSCGLDTNALAQPAKLYMENLSFPISLKSGCSYALTLYVGKLDTVDPNTLKPAYAWNPTPINISKEQIAQHIATNGTAALALPLPLTLSNEAQTAGISFVAGGTATNVPVFPVSPVTPVVPVNPPTGGGLPGGVVIPSSVPPVGNATVNWGGAETLTGVNAESNKEMKIADVLTGRKYLLFVASARWCGPCKQFYGEISKAIKENGIDKNCAIAVTGAGGGGNEYADGADMAGIFKKNGNIPPKYGFVMDAQDQNTYFKKLSGKGFSSVPSWVLVGIDGKKVTAGVGGANFSGNEFDVCRGGF